LIKYQKLTTSGIGFGILISNAFGLQTRKSEVGFGSRLDEAVLFESHYNLDCFFALSSSNLMLIAMT